MSTFTIEENVSVPPRAYGPRESKYPFRRMSPGQSFLVPASTKADTIRSAVGAFNKNNKGFGKFAVRSTDAGIRVWRVE